jgi:hypothetical protein
MIFDFIIVPQCVKVLVQDPTVLAVPSKDSGKSRRPESVVLVLVCSVQVGKRKEGKAWLWAGQIMVVGKDQITRKRCLSANISAADFAEAQ